MAALQTDLYSLQFPVFRSPKLCYSRNSHSISFSRKLRVSNWSLRAGNGVYPLRCLCKASSEIEVVSVANEEIERPTFDINLAVILAGFAFEAYTSPPENVGKREVDAANCQTVFLSESFLREIFDGQLFIKLKEGFSFPAMDPWGTSDPYVVMQLDSQVVKSKVKWGTKEPTWNEEFALNIKQPPTKNLQVAAWDANLVTPHKRMGNAGVSLDWLCDGNMHEVLVDLEGMGGGGKIKLEIKYKSFDEIIEEKKWWRIPIITEFLRKNGLESALKKVLGSDSVQAREFVQYAFGQLKAINNAYLHKEFSDIEKYDNQNIGKSSDHDVESDIAPKLERSLESSSNDTGCKEDTNLQEFAPDNEGMNNGDASSSGTQVGETSQSDQQFWKNFTDTINQTVVQKLGLSAPDKIKWDGFDLLNKIGLQSRKIAEAGYIESGLATPEVQDAKGDATAGQLTKSTSQPSLPDIKKVTQDLLRQTDSILGALMVLNATVSQFSKDTQLLRKTDTKEDASAEEAEDSTKMENSLNGSGLDEKRAEEMKELFSTAESAMEAWAMLATSLGHPTFIKSEFEKLCFFDNASTDTQVALWRDSGRERLVVAFRGTEQARWKDLRTDLMLVPAGLNPERIGGDFKQEVQVHSGFLSAYDSVRTRLISLIKLAIGYVDDGPELQSKWHVYVTGHSLGGALATLLALELSSSQMAKHGAITVTMYNFGSPRVGNKRFAEVYNEGQILIGTQW